jgi:cytosine/adenosine deaminase-related metal-dependent hydrolase
MTNQEEFRQLQSSQPLIHRGPWVITGLSSTAEGTACSIMEDGALLIADGMIRAVGSYRDITREFGQYQTREYEGRVLAPALINGHCHLELSYLDLAGGVQEQRSYNGDFTNWIRELLIRKENVLQDTAAAAEMVMRHARQTLQQMHAHGVAFVGDVGNSLASREIGEGQNTRVCFLLELLGLTKEAESNTLARLQNLAVNKTLSFGATPHAPYSTTPTVIRAIKKQAEQRGQVFSIHAAESRQEDEFLRSGTGPFKPFLQERGAWDGSFSIPGKGSVQYLESLGVLDDKTLCVHGVHVDNAEIEILARKRAKVCLCPGSNRFLQVGKAPVTEFLAHGILPAVGTDSKASNVMINMWREMQLLREDHPNLAPGTVFAMATCGGAEAWGMGSEIGSLEAGKQAAVIAVSHREKLKSAGEVFEYLTTEGESVKADWLE